jgi:hypothetical protein
MVDHAHPLFALFAIDEPTISTYRSIMSLDGVIGHLVFDNQLPPPGLANDITFNPVDKRKRGPSMKIHEYQAKELFRKNGVAVPDGAVAFSVEEAKAAAAKLGAYPVVVKAQIHAGGRGLGGGVKVARTARRIR